MGSSSFSPNKSRCSMAPTLDTSTFCFSSLSLAVSADGSVVSYIGVFTSSPFSLSVSYSPTLATLETSFGGASFSRVPNCLLNIGFSAVITVSLLADWIMLVICSAKTACAESAAASSPSAKRLKSPKVSANCVLYVSFCLSVSCTLPVTARCKAISSKKESTSRCALSATRFSNTCLVALALCVAPPI